MIVNVAGEDCGKKGRWAWKLKTMRLVILQIAKDPKFSVLC